MSREDSLGRDHPDKLMTLNNHMSCECAQCQVYERTMNALEAHERVIMECRESDT